MTEKQIREKISKNKYLGVKIKYPERLLELAEYKKSVAWKTSRGYNIKPASFFINWSLISIHTMISRGSFFEIESEEQP